MSASRSILVIEDGHEYVEAFSRLATGGGAALLVRAGDAEEAREALLRRIFDAVFVDVVFDRTPPEKLAGDLAAALERHGGDRARAIHELARQQGFQILAALAPDLPPDARVVLAIDFSAAPGRLAALRERVPGLEGLPEGAGASEALARLLR
jgi:CheY-like chemotaxis protein